MPRAEQPSRDDHPPPPRHQGSAEIAAVVARTAPAVLDLLADGAPRPGAAAVAALPGRRAKEDVAHTLMRLAVTGRVDEAGGRYALAAATGPAPDEG